MSAFDPINVRAPEDRRRALIDRLRSQYEDQRARAGSALSAPGRAFGTFLSFKGIPKVRQTQRDMILPEVLQALGAGHNPLQPGEFSPAPGREAAPPPFQAAPPPPPPPPPHANAPVPNEAAVEPPAYSDPNAAALAVGEVVDMNNLPPFFYNPFFNLPAYRPPNMSGVSEF